MGDEAAFVARYRRLEIIARTLNGAPEWLRRPASRRLAALHPYALSGGDYRAGLQAGLQVDAAQAAMLNRRYLERETWGFLHYRHYAHIDRRWLDRRVRIEGNTRTWRPSDGGLVLTYHTPEWHLLGVILGLLGGKVYPLAMAPETSPLEPHLRGYLHGLHAATRVHFGGGDYLFVREGPAALAQAEARLREGGLIIALTDQHHALASAQHASGHVFGHRVCPRAGIIRTALGLGRPVLLATLELDAELRDYKIMLRAIDAATLEGVLQVYFAHLESWLRECPDVWHGWHDLARWPRD